MSAGLKALEEAYALFQTEDSRDTYLAVVIVAIVVSPVVWRLYQSQNDR